MAHAIRSCASLALLLALGCSGSVDDAGKGTSGAAGQGNPGGNSSAGANASGGNSADMSNAGHSGGGAPGGMNSGGRSNGGMSSGGTSSAGQDGGGAATQDMYGDARTRCVARTNELRATKGLPPIPQLSKAEPCADGQAKKDSETGKAHSAFSDCLDQVKWMGAGQNECPNYGSVEDTLKGCLDAMWAEGPGGGHYDNMVGNSTHTACGFYTTPEGKVWMVEDFWTE